MKCEEEKWYIWKSQLISVESEHLPSKVDAAE